MAMQTSLAFLKSRLETISDVCKDFVINSEEDYELCNLHINDIEDIKHQHSEILARLEPNVEWFNAENQFLQRLKLLECHLRVLIKRFDNHHLPHVNVDGSSTGNNDSSSTQSFVPQFKLPELNLPKYSGEHEHWARFADTFTAMITNNPGIPDAVKLFYLENCLKGEARARLLSLPQGSVDFQTAWNLLHSRYNNPRVVATKHVKAILEAKPADGTATSMRLLCDSFTSNVNALKSLPDINLENLLLTHLFMQKIDFESIRDFEFQNSPTKVPKFEEVVEFLERRAKILDSTAVRSTASHQFSNLPTNSNNVSFVDSHQNSVKTKCPQCGQAHYLHQCSTFRRLSLQLRKDLVNNKKLCIICLGKPTSGHKCFKPCRHCNSAHHHLLHQFVGSGSGMNKGINMFTNASVNEDVLDIHNSAAGLSTQPPSALPYQHVPNAQLTIPAHNVSTANFSPASRDHPVVDSLSTRGPSYQHTSSIAPRAVNEVVASSGQDNLASCTTNPDGEGHITMHATPETVTHRCLLATVALYVSGADGVLHPATAVLDSGSSINLIERSFARRLGLPQHAITAHIQCVDGARVKPHGSIQLAIESMVTSWKTNVQALVVDSITHELPATSFSTANWNIPKGMPLADPRFSHSKPVDLLLGAELFYSCLRQARCRLGTVCPICSTAILVGSLPGPRSLLIRWSHVTSPHSLVSPSRNTLSNGFGS